MAWLVLAAGSACGGPSQVVDTPEGSRGDNDVRQQCEASGRRVRSVDVNQDGRPEIRHVYDGERELCAQFDLNFDGAVDVTRFFDPDGSAVIQEEHDLDFDGRIDQIAYFARGRLSRLEIDSNYDNRIDTWLWCGTGKRVARAERDRHHHGRPDTWEMFEDGVLTEARYDDNNDGRPERWELFRDGRLYQVKRDSNLDGEADQVDEIPEEHAGEREQAQTCDGSVVASMAGASPPTAGGSDPGAGQTADPSAGGSEGGPEPGGPNAAQEDSARQDSARQDSEASEGAGREADTDATGERAEPAAPGGGGANQSGQASSEGSEP